MLVPDFLRKSAARHGERDLLVRGAERLSYGKADRDADRVAGGLAELGLPRGARVGLLSANTPVYVAGYFGILRAGGIAVPLNPALSGRDVAGLLGDCEAFALVAGERQADKAADACRHREGLRGIHADGDAPGPGWIAFPDLSGSAAQRDPGIADTDPAAIIYTSGSTGRPRGATLTHRNIVHNTRAILDYLALTKEDRVLDVLPFYYVYGQSLLHTHVAVGGALVVEESLLFPDRVLDRIDEERVTGLSGVPSTFAILLARSRLAERRFPSLRYVTQAGGAMPVAHIERVRAALPDVQLFIMYGATEASARLSYLPPEELSRRMGSIGRALPGVTLTLVKDDGTVASPGEVGEIVASGPNMMSGYWNDAEETARVTGPHGFHTGDLARADEDGYLYIVGRSRDMIKAGANRISAREIEDVLAAHASVAEVAVIGVPDDMLGEAIHAFVQPAPGASPDAEALREHCRAHLPAFKIPRDVTFRAELPRTGSGKIDKPALRAGVRPAGD